MVLEEFLHTVLLHVLSIVTVRIINILDVL